MTRTHLSFIISFILIGLIAVVSIVAQGKGSAAPKSISAADLNKLLADPAGKVLLVDVRTGEEYKTGRIPEAVLFPYDEMEAKKTEFSRLAGGLDRPIVVYCRSGRRSAVAAETLIKLGYTNVADFGGIGNWKGRLER